MKKYFYRDNNQNLGPFSLQELQSKYITPQTYVWYEGLAEWQPASQIPELQSLFGQSGPVQYSSNAQAQHPNSHTTHHNTTTYNNYSAPQTPPHYPLPKSWLVESILVTVLCCLPFGIIGIVNASKVESKYYAGDYLGAEKASKEAKKWSLIGVGTGLVGGILYFILIIIIGILEA